LEEDIKVDKEQILSELDKISFNYKTYAESHKKLISIGDEYEKMKSDYNHNYKLLTEYQENIKYFLT